MPITTVAIDMRIGRLCVEGFFSLYDAFTVMVKMAGSFFTIYDLAESPSVG